MTAATVQKMVITTVRDPASAARDLMALHLPRQALWIGLVLVAVMNTAMYVLSHLITPVDPSQPAIFNVPAPVYLGLVAAGLILTVYSLVWTGRMLGGSGSLDDVLVLIVWLQTLRVAVQVVILLLLLVAPFLAALIVFAVMVLGVYILVHFINQAHRLESLGRAVGVLIASVLAIAIALSVLLALLGGPIIGTPNV